MLNSMQQRPIISVKHPTPDRLEHLGQFGRPLLERQGLELVGISDRVDVGGEMTEEEAVVGVIDVLGDFNVGAVDTVRRRGQ